MSEISPMFVVSPWSNFCLDIGAPPLPFFSDLSNWPPTSCPVSTILSSIISPQSPQIISPFWSSCVRFILLHSGHLLTKFIGRKVYKELFGGEYLKLLVWFLFVLSEN